MLTTRDSRLRGIKDDIEDEVDAELAEVYATEELEMPRFQSKWYVSGLWPFRRISFECPHCSRWLSVKSRHSARMGHCPSCDLTIAAPDLDTDLPAALVSRGKGGLATAVEDAPVEDAPVFRARPADPSRLPESSVQPAEQDSPGEGEEAWGINPDTSLVPVRVVTRYQNVAPWLGVAAALCGTFLLGKSFVAMQSPPRTAIVPVPAEQVEKPKADLGSALWVVLDSLATATTPEEMATMVRNPEEMLPKMSGYYAEHQIELPHQFERATPGTKLYEMNGTRFARFEGRLDGRPVKFTFESTEFGWRLDWESMIGYSDMPWAAFLAERPEGRHEFRVLAKIVVDPLLEYDRKRYFCLQLTDHLGTGTGFALVERYGISATKLEKFLALYDQGKHPSTWILPVLTPVEGSDELLEMVDVKRGSWLDL